MSFYEEQRFQQRWVWWPLLAATLGSAGLFGYGIFQQLVLDQPWGERPMSDAGLVLAGLLTTGLLLGIVWLFRVLRLVVEVGEEALVVQFAPLHKRVIPYHTIRSCRAITYRPLRDYGGWGIRFSRRGQAYNVSGNRGVLLVFDSGRPLMIGSQRAEALAAAIATRLGD